MCEINDKEKSVQGLSFTIDSEMYRDFQLELVCLYVNIAYNVYITQILKTFYMLH